MCANCGAMSVQFDAIDKDMTFSGTVNNRLVTSVNEEINIDVSYGRHLAYTDIKVDPATPLPKGLTFENNKITGSVDHPVNTYIHIIYTDDLDIINGGTLNLTVLAVKQIDATGLEAKPGSIVEPDKDKKCSMSVGAASALVSLIAVAGVGLLLLRRKEN
jgi:hypothetical protein